MKIVIETIPHKDQRYPTVGDWYFTDPTGGRLDLACLNDAVMPDTLHIKVSDLGSWKREMLVAVHELVEVALCSAQSINPNEVDRFDTAFEVEREKRLAAASTEAERQLILAEEPGDQEAAPYRRQHCFATGVERLMAAVLGVTWAPYEKQIEEL